ncbi:alkyl/aryl-sulfatase [Acinetobacter sp. ANC 4648]|uniref:alkyl/aryl-sulfatase n=1 Tax=Acinetobacter sp. ANC 4648 TaxID=1977875 RepID=UPI000A3455E3|nr:alkyl sulfatase dimerization domain-containing protein [Acinetobacter sp. ANC 4648]OTG80327.1 hypothetical protein B9T27_13240 [Acinetobacter sp. ANC 4648]
MKYGLKLFVLSVGLFAYPTYAALAEQKVPQLERKQDLQNAQRGFIARPYGTLVDEQGKLIWSYDDYKFLENYAGNSINPKLLTQAKLNQNIGLFKVTDGVWQLRGFDLANITVIEGKTGWIIVDTLASKETAEAALKFLRTQLGHKKISAIVLTHNHYDHFGGVEAFLEDKNIPIIAPSGFMDAATSENIMAGPIMGKRAAYMFGMNLDVNEKQLVDSGLGKGLSFGTVTIVQPTILIDQPSQKLNVDGIDFDFFNVPASEAPSELTFSIESKKLYCGSEIITHTMHNLYTLRGAKARDTLKWVKYLNEAKDYNDRAGTEVLVSQHHWPVWGNQNISEFIALHRDVYKFLHDQTLKMMNQSYTADEIVEQIKLPENLNKQLSIGGYYGSIKHNVKGIYQYYIGWFDGNPANLDMLPRKQRSLKYVSILGGENAVLRSALEAQKQKEFRWAAELLNHILNVNANNDAAKKVLSEVYLTLGYDAESVSWRNFYISAAKDLRNEKSTYDRKKIDMSAILQQAPSTLSLKNYQHL